MFEIIGIEDTFNHNLELHGLWFSKRREYGNIKTLSKVWVPAINHCYENCKFRHSCPQCIYW